MEGIANRTSVIGMRQVIWTTVALILFTVMSTPAALEDFYDVANAQSSTNYSYIHMFPNGYVHVTCHVPQARASICYINIHVGAYSIYCVGLSESGYRCYNNWGNMNEVSTSDGTPDS
jgi:hypothetical protein